MRELVTHVACILVGLVIAVAWMASGSWPFNAPVIKLTTYGCFHKKPPKLYPPDGVNRVLDEDFIYIDPNFRVWTAPKGTPTDGASIPPVFQLVVGTPWDAEEKYVNAAIIHDAACERQADPPEVVHEMFYYACLCEGVPTYKAKLLYAAVMNFK